jgi:hypothetical protein
MSQQRSLEIQSGPVQESFLERSFLSFFLNHQSFWTGWLNQFSGSWQAIVHYHRNRHLMAQRLQQLNQRAIWLEQLSTEAKTLQGASRLNIKR